MNKKVWTIFGLIIILIIAVTASVFSWFLGKCNYVEISDKQAVLSPKDILIFKKHEGWGPCPENLTCSLEAYLYDSGKLVFKGDLNLETIVTQEDLKKVKDEIRTSMVMEKDCTGSLVMDYGVDYEINLDGKTKIIGSDGTGCWDDLNNVNKIINSYNQGFVPQGGA